MDQPPVTASSSSQLKPSLWRQFWDFPLTRVVAYFGLFAVILTVLALPVSLLAGTRSSMSDTQQGWFFVTAEAFQALAAILAFWIMVRFADKRSLTGAGFAVPGMFSQTGIGLLIGGGVFSAVIGLMTSIHAYHLVQVNAPFQPLQPLLLFLLVALFEETAFRGYVFQTLEARWGSGAALTGSALLFGLVHLGNPIGSVTPWQHLVGPLFITLESGILLAAAYLLTRRLWLPIGIHWGWNFFESTIYGAADSGTHLTNSLFQSRVSGPFLATGGPFGPEASLPCLLLSTYAGLLLLRLAIRKGHWRTRDSVRENIQSESILR